MARNSYTNKGDRVSFVILVYLCDEGDECKSNKEIAILLKEFYWTLFVIEDQVKFKKTDDDKTPYIQIDSFHS